MPVFLAIVASSCGGGGDSSAPVGPVTSASVTSVSINPTSAAMRVGDTVHFAATVVGAGTFSQAVTWSSNDATKATVNADGLVEARGEGTVTVIAASVTDPTKRGTAALTIGRRQFDLTVVAGTGTTGGPASARLDSGTVVTFTFGLAAGYQRLLVHRDTTTVASSGSFTLVSATTLHATADAKLDAGSADAATSQQLTSIVHSSTPMADFRAMTATTDSLVRVLGPALALQKIRASRALSLDAVRDAAALNRAFGVIADTLFAQAVSDTGLFTASRANAHPTSATRATTTPEINFIYVNGINTNPDEEATTLSTFLSPLIDLAGYQDRNRFPVTRFYNKSGKYVDGNVWNLLACLTMKLGQYQAGQQSSGESLAECIAEFLPTFGIGDLLQSLAQVLNQKIFNSLPALAQSEAKDLANVVNGDLGRGGKVVLIAHSQGNLMVTEALQTLRSSGVSLGCVGVVSIAPPVAIPSPAGGPTVASMIIADGPAEDALLVFGLNPAGTPRVTNSLSAGWVSSDLLLRLPDNLVTEVHRIYSGIDLHSIDWSYLASTGTKEKVVTDIQLEAAAVSGCNPPVVTVNPAAFSLQSLQTATLAATVSGSADHNVIWTSSNSNIASVSAGGVVTGHSVGKATIAARHASGVAGFATATVNAGTASITINSINSGGLPINIAALKGQIDVTLDAQGGGRTITRIDLFVGSTLVGQVLIGTGSSAPDEARDRALALLTMSFLASRLNDGTYQMRADMYLKDVSTPVSSGSVTVTIKN